jgi:putative hemolysin
MRLISALTAVLLIAVSASALRNPAAVYCEELDNTYVIESGGMGEVGYCILKGSAVKVDAWAFLQGKVAQNESYCARNGFRSGISKDPKTCGALLSGSCAVCVKDGKEVEVTHLMNLTFAETECGDGHCGFPENFLNCPADCPSGGIDSSCDAKADGICDKDCWSGQDPDCPASAPTTLRPASTLPLTKPLQEPTGKGCFPMLLAPAAALLAGLAAILRP